MSDYVRTAGAAAMIALSQPRDAPSDNEDDAPTSCPAGGGDSPAVADPPSGRGGGSSSSSARKPRGRPPGSKNKPKPPVVITKASESAMHPVVLELAGGCDIVFGVSDFARRRGVCVSVLGGSGAVANVTLRHPSALGQGIISVPGRLDILSLSGTLLPPAPPSPASASAWPVRPPPLTVSLVGPHGQVIGGTVAGPMTAVGQVLLVAATFTKPEFHRLPTTEDEDEDESTKEDLKPGTEAMVLAICDPAASSAMPGGLLTHPDVVLWAQPSSSRPPPHSHPPPHF